MSFITVASGKNLLHKDTPKPQKMPPIAKQREKFDAY
jgi:hypothetical protein